MRYLTAQKVVSPSSRQSGVNAFRYTNAAIRSFELTVAEDVGELEAQLIEVPPGGNDVVCFVDVFAPDGAALPTIERALQALQAAWSKDQTGRVEVDEIRAVFAPGRTPANATGDELDGLIRRVLEVARAAPSQFPLEANPLVINVSASADGHRFWLSPESERRLRVVNGPDWRPASLSVARDVAADFAVVAAPSFGPLEHQVVQTLTSLDLARIHALFGGVRFIAEPGGSTLRVWPPLDVRQGYCLACHRHETLRDAGPGTFVCAHCGNVQATDGLWVAALG